MTSLCKENILKIEKQPVFLFLVLTIQMAKRDRAKRITFEVTTEIWNLVHQLALLHNISIRMLMMRLVYPKIKEMQDLNIKDNK